MELAPELLRQCWFLAGPTATGKTEAGILLAERLGGEIVALDSMTLYRGMDVGTAKPTPAEQARVPHHLLDRLEPDQEFSVADYVAAAAETCAAIVARGRTPLFVGGTGLYLRGILRGVFAGPPADSRLRQGLQEEAERRGPAALHARLATVDRLSAARLHPHDVRRVIRALEVFELTGRPLSEQQRQGPRPPVERPRHVYWLEPPRAWLYERIDRRVEAMFAAGLVDEVRRLSTPPHRLGKTARQALGYKEVLDYFSSRFASLDETRCAIQQRTRRFAKRQHTWYRNLEECRAVSMTGDESPTERVERLLQFAGSHP